MYCFTYFCIDTYYFLTNNTTEPSKAFPYLLSSDFPTVVGTSCST
jgi:hypothetical protein